MISEIKPHHKPKDHKKHKHNHNEHGSEAHHGHHHATIKKNDGVLTTYILLLAMGIHSFFEGVAMGVC